MITASQGLQPVNRSAILLGPAPRTNCAPCLILRACILGALSCPGVDAFVTPDNPKTYAILEIPSIFRPDFDGLEGYYSLKSRFGPRVSSEDEHFECQANKENKSMTARFICHPDGTIEDRALTIQEYEAHKLRQFQEIQKRGHSGSLGGIVFFFLCFVLMYWAGPLVFRLTDYLLP